MGSDETRDAVEAALLPRPRRLAPTGDEFRPRSDGHVVLDLPEPGRLVGAARRSIDRAGLGWSLTASPAVPTEKVAVIVQIDPGVTGHAQGFSLTAHGGLITVTADDLAGARYGLAAAVQLAAASTSGVQGVEMTDWPALERRGFMLDVSRDKVPTMATLELLVDMLADLRFNELQLYTEHTFAYQAHPAVWERASPMTPEEILRLDAYCAESGIELVPNQNSFGHLERWFGHEPYRQLAEAPEGFTTPYGVTYPHGFSLNASDPAIFDFLAGLYDELLPNFSSNRFNVGLDETWDLGQGRSAEVVARRGKGRVYLDTLRRIADLVGERDRQMMFWGDIVNEHPELVGDLPGGIVALEWGYEAGHPFDEHAGRYEAAGVPFRLCPGTSGWNTVGGRVANALANIDEAVDAAVAHGAEGILLTDWGDNGHWQPLPVSLPGLVRAGSMAWDPDSNREVDVPTAVNLIADDSAGRLGQLLDRLGRVHEQVGLEVPNSTPLFWMLRLRPHRLADLLESTTPSVQRDEVVSGLFGVEESLSAVSDALAQAPPQARRLGVEVTTAELSWVTDMLLAASRRGRAALGGDTRAREAFEGQADRVLAGHREVWLARNREGGRADSVRRLEQIFSRS